MPIVRALFSQASSTLPSHLARICRHPTGWFTNGGMRPGGVLLDRCFQPPAQLCSRSVLVPYDAAVRLECSIGILPSQRAARNTTGTAVSAFWLKWAAKDENPNTAGAAIEEKQRRESGVLQADEAGCQPASPVPGVLPDNDFMGQQSPEPRIFPGLSTASCTSAGNNPPCVFSSPSTALPCESPATASVSQSSQNILTKAVSQCRCGIGLLGPSRPPFPALRRALLPDHHVQVSLQHVHDLPVRPDIDHPQPLLLPNRHPHRDGRAPLRARVSVARM